LSSLELISFDRAWSKQGFKLTHHRTLKLFLMILNVVNSSQLLDDWTVTLSVVAGTWPEINAQLLVLSSLFQHTLTLSWVGIAGLYCHFTGQMRFRSPSRQCHSTGRV